MTEDAATLRTGELHSPELRTGDTWDAVVAGQPVIQKRIIGVQELRHRLVLAQQVLKEQARFGFHGIAEIRTPIGELLGVGLDAVQVPRLEPLPGKIVGEGRGARIGQETFDLSVQHSGRGELAGFGQREQLVVRHRAPEEIAQARGELEIGNPMHLGRIRSIRVSLDTEQEMGGNQHRLNRQLDALLD